MPAPAPWASARQATAWRGVCRSPETVRPSSSWIVRLSASSEGMLTVSPRSPAVHVLHRSFPRYLQAWGGLQCAPKDSRGQRGVLGWPLRPGQRWKSKVTGCDTGLTESDQDCADSNQGNPLSEQLGALLAC